MALFTKLQHLNKSKTGTPVQTQQMVELRCGVISVTKPEYFCYVTVMWLMHLMWGVHLLYFF